MLELKKSTDYEKTSVEDTSARVTPVYRVSDHDESLVREALEYPLGGGSWDAGRREAQYSEGCFEKKRVVK